MKENLNKSGKFSFKKGNTLQANRNICKLGAEITTKSTKV